MDNKVLIKNGHVKTMDDRKTAEWVAIEDGIIREVGDGDSYKKLLNDEYRIIDAEGRSVLPGFFDSDFHVVKTALAEEYLDLSGALSFDEVGKIIRDWTEQHPGERVVAKHLEIAAMKEGRFPDRTVIDKYCDNVPVAIYSTDLHVLMLNTYGILYYKVPFTLKGIDLDENDVPTGIFRNQAGAKLDVNIIRSFSSAEVNDYITAFLPRILGNGITSLAAMEGGNIKNHFGEDYESEIVYEHLEDYPLSMYLYYQTTDVERVEDKGLTRIGGALYLDGTLSARTASLSFEYDDEPGRKGILCFEQSFIEDFVDECCEKNIQIAFDAIGDVAIESALQAFEKASKKYDVRRLRPRIEHAELITEEQMKRAAELGVILSMQPTYEGYWGMSGGMYSRRLGKRYGMTNQFRKITDSGVIICGGSDAPVTDFNPFTGIYYAVNHPVKEHSVELDEAIAMYTINGAYSMFCEEFTGSVTPGKQADIVVLDCNIDDVPKEELMRISVDLTIKSGEIMFDRKM